MGALPTSDMPGHKQLHDKVFSALHRCQESQRIEFKESAPWESLKWKIIRTALAMANLRDGGIIVIGPSERGNTWDLSTGITNEHLKSYDIDTVLDCINNYASPYIELEMVVVKYKNEKEFLAIQVSEFVDTPIVYVRRVNQMTLKRGESI